jgi:hypothetical protein
MKTSNALFGFVTLFLPVLVEAHEKNTGDIHGHSTTFSAYHVSVARSSNNFRGSKYYRSSRYSRTSSYFRRSNTHRFHHYKVVFTRFAVHSVYKNSAARRRAEARMFKLEALSLFSQMKLQDSGLNAQAFEYAWLGYRRLLKKGVIRKRDVLSICDFSQSSGSKRMYVIDVRGKRLLYHTYVAHGIQSGREYANAFSNTPESNKSSLGFYVTRKTYYGANGLSLRIDGVDRGFNNNASERNIVIHGASYVSERILHKYGLMGTTFGCPAIPEEMTKQIIPVLKDGSCFFIYYPSKRYLTRSTVING